MTDTTIKTEAQAAARIAISDGIKQITHITGGMRMRPRDRLAALTLMTAALVREKRDAARDLRGEGMSWAEVAPLLGTDLNPGNPAVSAFEYVVPVRDDFPLDPRTCSWRCHTCDNYISDRGPYNGHPVDCERGHAADCERNNDAIAEYLKQRNEDWNED